MRLRSAFALVLLAGLAACGRADDDEADRGANHAVVPSAQEETVAPAPNEAEAIATPSPAPLDELAGIRIGMTIAEMRARGLTVRHDPGPDPESPCGYARVDGMPDVYFMLDGPQVARIEVASPFYKTIGGVQVGLSEAEAIKRLGNKVVVKPHPYTGPTGHYLIVHEKNAPLGLILETDGKTVISYRIGRWTQVQWIEGCS